MVSQVIRKKVLAGALCALLVGTSACASGNGSGGGVDSQAGEQGAPSETGASGVQPAEVAGDVDILWWSFDSENAGTRGKPDVYKEIFTDYNETHGTNYKLTYEYIPFDDYSGSKLMTAFAADSGPDIYLLCPPYLPNYVNSGAAMPLTDYYTDEMLQDFSTELIKNATMGGEIYTIPLHMDLLALWYDAKLFREEGVKVPDGFGFITQVATEVGGKRYYRDCSNETGVWGKWIKYAISKNPDSNTIPFINGYEGDGYIAKTQEGIVLFSMSCYRVDKAAITGNETIVTLPEGFRPKNRLTKPIIGSDESGKTTVVGHLYVDVTGNITLWPGSPSFGITTDFTFITQ